ncbi:MAG: serine/threonine protein kinase [Marinosulfonomonas sp.]|nr:MAG: serine/threonine protein kinase [Marinosulfonomonas sp.]
MNSTVTNETASEGKFTDELQPGTSLLQGQYVIESFLNSGGFGMTYLAKDSLDRRVVIKECFPASFCTRNDTVVRARSRTHQKDFKSIVRLFVLEARRLSKLKHPNIVGVHQVFEDNETAYMALDYVDGQDLLDIFDEKKRILAPEDLRKILLKILDAIGFIHQQNILHRDISPDNILLDQSGEPILIDFGAAREKASKASRALSALLVVKDGYSPQEFYIAGSEQGPASDIYALAATFYHMVVGEAPPNSQTRLAAVAAKEDDPYKPAGAMVAGYDKEFLEAIDKALSIFPNERFQSAQEWSIEIDVEKRIEHALAAAQNDKNIDLSISLLVSETNRVVYAEKKLADNTSVAKAEVTEKTKSTQDQPKVDEFVQSDSEMNLDENTLGRKRWFFRRSRGERTLRRFWPSGKSRTEHFGKAGL